MDERSAGAVAAIYLAIFWRLDHETEFRCENLPSKDLIRVRPATAKASGAPGFQNAYMLTVRARASTPQL